MRLVVAVCGIVVTALLAGCTQARHAALASAAIDTLPGGIVRVRNTAPTRWVDTNGWRLVLDRTIHPPAGSPGELIHPEHVVASSGGDIFVLDNKPAALKHYGPDGHYIGVIGREGSGPGEYHDYGVLYIAHDTLLHQDASQSRIDVFTLDGRFIRNWTSTPISLTDLFADDSGRIPVMVAVGSMQINGGKRVARFRVDGSVADTIWYPAAPEPVTWRVQTTHSDMGMVVPFTPERVNTFDRAGRLIWGDESNDRLVYSKRGGDTTRVVENATTPVPIADSTRHREFSDITTRYKWIAGVAKIEDIPSHYPVWTALVADGLNNLWVLRPGPRGNGDHWDVLDPDGRLLGAVPAPFDHADDTYWTRDHVYVLQQDSPDGTPAILVYRIERTTP